VVGFDIGVRLTRPSGCTHDPGMTRARSPMAMPGRSIRRRGWPSHRRPTGRRSRLARRDGALPNW